MIKKTILLSCYGFLSLSFFDAQTTIFGYLKDDKGKILEQVNVDLLESDNDVVVDKIGYFQFVGLKEGNYQITFSKHGFQPRIIEFEIKKGEKRKNLGNISLLPLLETNEDLGLISIDDAYDDETAIQPTIGLLGASRDAFQNLTAFELGGYFFRPRGLDNRYQKVLFNGVPMSNPDDERVDYSLWVGLNDITRYPIERKENASPSEYFFSSSAGIANFTTRASSFSKGTSLSYSLTNRSYRHRLMLTHATGMNKNGWAMSFSASRRWADLGIIDGVYQDSYAYFGSVEKRINSRFSMNFNILASPSYRALSSANTQEVYDLMGKNYNAYWGEFDGKSRNSRIRKNHQPILQLSLSHKISKNSLWENSFSYRFGREGSSRLDWYEANDPSPTYYRNLPSFWTAQFTKTNSDGGVEITPEEQNSLQEITQNFRNKSQIDWNQLYLQNSLFLNQGARYFLAEDVSKNKVFDYFSHFSTQLQPYWKLNLNFNYQYFFADKFREVKDLLGANFVENLDFFNQNKSYDLDRNSSKVGQGERILYSYQLERKSYIFNAFTQLNLPKWDAIFSGYLGHFISQRNGDFRHHFYSEESKGKSPKYSTWSIGLKGEIKYKINGKNFLTYIGSYDYQTPTLDEIFVNARFSNIFTPYLKNQIINTNELNYNYRGQKLKLKLATYFNQISNAMEISRYYTEGVSLSSSVRNALVTEILSGVEKKYFGAELGLDWKLNSYFNLMMAGSLGNYVYGKNPDLYLNTDTEKSVEHFSKVLISGQKIPSTPQKAFSLALKYTSKKYWWASFSANYLMDNYLDFSMLNRTENFYINPLTGERYDAVNNYDYSGIDIPAATPENVEKILAQRKNQNQMMLNASLGKSFSFGKYRLGFSLSVQNILGNRNYITGGYHQGRKSSFPEFYLEKQRNVPIFGEKIWYDRGRNYFANLYFRF